MQTCAFLGVDALEYSVHACQHILTLELPKFEYGSQIQ